METTTNREETICPLLIVVRIYRSRLCSVRLARKKRKPKKRRDAPGQSIRPGTRKRAAGV